MKKPTPKMLEFFKERTQNHINRVIKYMSQLVDFDGLEAKELSERARAHDQDKYTDPDKVIPYIWVTEYHRQNNEGAVDEVTQQQYELAQEATGDHINVNRHHPEYFENIEDVELIDLAEMVSDWFAMGEELGNSARDWADENIGSKWNFTEEQVDTIYALIDHLERKSQSKQARTLNQLDALRSAIRKYRKNKVGREKVQKAIDRAKAIGYSDRAVQDILREESMPNFGFVVKAGASAEDIQDAQDVLRDFITYDPRGLVLRRSFRWVGPKRGKGSPIHYVLDEVQKQASSNTPESIPIKDVYTHSDWGRRIPKSNLKNPVIVLQLLNKSIIKGKKYLVLDGQHRIFTLLDAGQNTVRAYVVKLPYKKIGGTYGLLHPSTTAKTARVQNKLKAVEKAALRAKRKPTAIPKLNKIIDYALDVGHGYTYFDIQNLLDELGLDYQTQEGSLTVVASTPTRREIMRRRKPITRRHPRSVLAERPDISAERRIFKKMDNLNKLAAKALKLFEQIQYSDSMDAIDAEDELEDVLNRLYDGTHHPVL